MVLNQDDLDDGLDGQKTLKVAIPAEQHLKLHQLKILTGTNISDTVADAVRVFFQRAEELPIGLSDVEQDASGG